AGAAYGGVGYGCAAESAGVVPGTCLRAVPEAGCGGAPAESGTAGYRAAGLDYAGDGRANGPEAVRLHVVSRRIRSEARAHRGEHATRPSADGLRAAAQSLGLCTLALHRRPSADPARGGKSHVAGGLRHGSGEDGGRFWQPGRTAIAPATIGLAGGGLPGER